MCGRKYSEKTIVLSPYSKGNYNVEIVYVDNDNIVLSPCFKGNYNSGITCCIKP